MRGNKRQLIPYMQIPLFGVFLRFHKVILLNTLQNIQLFRVTNGVRRLRQIDL